MASTTNYGWTTPDDTGLVKDGASAIRTLGSAVDSSVKALNPGTTSGDIDYYTSSTAKARLAKGTAGQVLTMNSGATAPEWAAAPTGGMTLISTTSLTGSSVVLSSIPSTYKDLRVIVENAKPATDADYLRIRFNNDSTANRHEGRVTTASNNTPLSFGDTAFYIAPEADNGTSYGLSNVLIPDYTNTTTWKMGFVNSITTDPATTTQFRAYWLTGFYNQTSAISSLEFHYLSGNFASGTVYLYGVK